MSIIKKMKDPVSSLTHMAWAILAVPVTVVLIIMSLNSGGRHIISFIVFGISLILLYTASAVYHMIAKPELQQILKKIDHSMIFVLIAGTYTPICILILNGIWGVGILASVWITAAVGIILKVFWNMPRVVSAGIYVIMGWASLVAFAPLSAAMPLGGLLLLIGGGLVYTLGAIIYAAKWQPVNLKFFGFHELFHIFVMAGTVCHVILMFIYVLPA